MSDCIVCVSTVPDQTTGQRMARAVVGEGLAACVNLIPVAASIYRWQGEVCEDAEVLAILKTTAASESALRDAWVTMHPYDCPEFLAIPVTGGHAPYLAWIAAATRSA